ncbi:MAG: hypothetical protein SOV61_08545 [Lachnospiraceae bacterium]|nr:hypothetical protein [Lachnospiraceae bacterium]
MEVDGAMKVQNQNTTIFFGDNTRRERQNNVKEQENARSNIFAGNLNRKLDPIARKRQEAREKAMKIVSDAWAGEQELDGRLEESRNKIRQYQKEMGNAGEEINKLREERLALREAYSVEEDSQEEQDLKLLEKKVDAQIPGSGVTLTMEEKKRIAEIEEAGLTEYQQHALSLKEGEKAYRIEMEEAEEGIQAENAFIAGTKLNRLKSQTMIKADKSADAVLEAASDEIVGMLMDEAKDHIDEEMEEREETSREKAEKKKKEEEKLEELKEDKNKKKEFAEAISDQTEVVSQYMLELDGTMEAVQKEIKKIMDEMKLTEEELKGAAVDTVR